MDLETAIAIWIVWSPIPLASNNVKYAMCVEAYEVIKAHADNHLLEREKVLANEHQEQSR